MFDLFPPALPRYWARQATTNFKKIGKPAKTYIRKSVAEAGKKLNAFLSQVDSFRLSLKTIEAVGTTDQIQTNLLLSKDPKVLKDNRISINLYGLHKLGLELLEYPVFLLIKKLLIQLERIKSSSLFIWSKKGVLNLVQFQFLRKLTSWRLLRKVSARKAYLLILEYQKVKAIPLHKKMIPSSLPLPLTFPRGKGANPFPRGKGNDSEQENGGYDSESV